MSNLVTQTFRGMDGGMNLAVNPALIPDGQAVYLQDIMLDQPGLMRRRGGNDTIASTNLNTAWVVHGASLAFDINGNPVGGSPFSNTSGAANLALNIFAPGAGTSGNYTMGDTAVPNGTRLIIDGKPALRNGTFVGYSDKYLGATISQLAYWRGGGASTGSNNSGNATITQGSKAVTGSSTSWVAGDVGRFLFDASGRLAGVIAAVNSSTSITLEDFAICPNQTTLGHTILPVRPFSVRVGKGRITVSNGSANVIGAGTKFTYFTESGGTWDLYKASDYSPIGTVTSVQSNTGLTLTANATVNLFNERFVAIKRIDSRLWSNPFLGFLTTTYAGRQFYANNPETQSLSYRLWFSEINEPEAVDLTNDGDFIDVVSSQGLTSPIVGIVGLQNVLLIFKETEIYGLFGATPDQFTLRKIADFGCLGANSIQVWNGAAIFASRSGIYMYDGATMQALSPQLTPWWRDSLSAYTLSTNTVDSFIYRDHYFLHIPSGFTSTYLLRKGPLTGTARTKITLCLNLATGAWTTLTHLAPVGFVNWPVSTGRTPVYLQKDTTGGAYWQLSADAIFTNTAANDDITAASEPVTGPDFYIESKRYDMKDPEHKKFFKQLAMTYKLINGELAMDTITDLNDTGTPTTTQWLANNQFGSARIKFLRRGKIMGFRLYQSSNAITTAVISTFSFGFKWMRPGKV